MTGNQVLQIRVELMGIEPAVWRRILIGADCTFWDLHVAIQDAMGWQDSHLHLFDVDDPATGRQRLIGFPMEDDELGVEPGWEHQVAEVLSIAQPRAMYEYDFGDSWEHDVVLEDILPADGGAYPRCVAGVRACPPEDVGGIPGYEEFLKVIADRRHEEHDRYLEWVGGSFDPERFDAKGVEFQDPQARWEEVFGAPKGALGGPASAAPPAQQLQLEGGFAPEELQRLLLSPFDEDSPLHLVTDLPDEVFAEAPLTRDCRSFLQLLAEEAPLKLTQKGNLPRAALARLVETGALGHPWWWELKAPKNESDAPRATLLRAMADLAGWTRKRHGKLELTKRGRAIVEGRTPAGEVYRTLIDRYVTRLNWAFPDALPESQWLQSCFWYALYLLQQHGDETRPSAFYADKFALAFPFALQDFAMVPYGSASENLGRALESRVLAGFATDFGLAQVSEQDPKHYREPRQVGAGPLLHRVVKWRRDATAAHPAPDEGAGTVVAGPWAPISEEEEWAWDADEALLACAAETPIAEVLAAFMTAQRRRLRSRQTIRKYEQVIELLLACLNTDGHTLLPDGDLAVYDRYAEESPQQRSFCEAFGPEWIAPHLDGFMARQAAGPAEVNRAAGTVCRKLVAWMAQEGLLGGGEAE